MPQIGQDRIALIRDDYRGIFTAVFSDEIVDAAGADGMGTDAAVRGGVTELVDRFGTVDGDAVVKKSAPRHRGVVIFA